MVYTLTDKLTFDDNPIIEVKSKKFEVQADAESVLKLLDILQTEGETKATLDAMALLFTEKDQKAIKALKLSFKDYTTFLTTAVSLALGEDPEDNTPGEE